MTIKSDKRQFSVVLPVEEFEKLEKLAEWELRPRSQLAAKIIIDYLKTIDFSKIEE